ncbi:MAG: DUF998 domain-containing protein [Anaerolineales bacterium]
MNRRHIGAWAGMIASVLFVVTFVAEGQLRPEYDPISMFISELSLGPRGWVQIVNFLLLGILLLVFSWGVGVEFRQATSLRFGTLLLALIGIGFLMSAPLVMDPAETPLDQRSLQGNLHHIFGALVFTLMPITCFAFLLRFRTDTKWRTLYWWTLVVAVLTTVAAILISIATLPSSTPTRLSEWVGLIQRFLIIPFLVWIFIFALALRREK